MLVATLAAAATPALRSHHPQGLEGPLRDRASPCTTNVTRCVTEKVAYTVCKKVHYNETRNVPYTVRRQVRGAYVDDKWRWARLRRPRPHFKEGAVARKQVPYSVTRNVTTVEKSMVPYNRLPLRRGAYVDDQGNAHGNDGPAAPSGKGPATRLPTPTPPRPWCRNSASRRSATPSTRWWKKGKSNA